MAGYRVAHYTAPKRLGWFGEFNVNVYGHIVPCVTGSSHVVGEGCRVAACWFSAYSRGGFTARAPDDGYSPDVFGQCNSSRTITTPLAANICFGDNPSVEYSFVQNSKGVGVLAGGVVGYNHLVVPSIVNTRCILVCATRYIVEVPCVGGVGSRATRYRYVHCPVVTVAGNTGNFSCDVNSGWLSYGVAAISHAAIMVGNLHAVGTCSKPRLVLRINHMP